LSELEKESLLEVNRWRTLRGLFVIGIGPLNTLHEEGYYGWEED